jgi:hypothetical protein
VSGRVKCYPGIRKIDGLEETEFCNFAFESSYPHECCCGGCSVYVHAATLGNVVGVCMRHEAVRCDGRCHIKRDVMVGQEETGRKRETGDHWALGIGHWALGI